MVDFKISVCEYRSSQLDVYVDAEYRDGRLRFSGQDLGPNTESAWGDSDYEYWYSFDEENTYKLMAALNVEENGFEQAVKERFSGVDGMRYLREFCGLHSISWDFSSYA